MKQRSVPLFGLCVAVWFLACQAGAEDGEGNGTGGAKALSGMSVLGNNEAPKSLVIVPWKTSEIGDGIGVAGLLDERAVPVDKEVFARELGYYRLRREASMSSSAHSGGEE